MVMRKSTISKTVTALAASLVFSGSVMGAIIEAKMVSVSGTYQGVHVVLDVVNHDVSDCKGAYADRSLLLEPSASNYDTIAGYIMAAGMANKVVKIDSRGCSSQGYSTIRDVTITL